MKKLKIGDDIWICCPYLGRWSERHIIAQRHSRRNEKSFMSRYQSVINDNLKKPLYSKELTIHAFESGRFVGLLSSILECEKGVGWEGLAKHLGFAHADIDFIENIQELMTDYKATEHLEAIVQLPKVAHKKSGQHLGPLNERKTISTREEKRRIKILDSLPDNCGWKGIMPHFSKKCKGWVVRNCPDLRRLVPEFMWSDTNKLAVKSKCECPICLQPYQTGVEVQKHLIEVHQIKIVVDSDSAYRRE